MNIKPVTTNNISNVSFKQRQKSDGRNKYSVSDKTTNHAAYNPKTMAMALALAVMTPSCSDNCRISSSIENRCETYQSLKKLHDDMNLHESLVWQLQTALNIDSMEIRKLNDNKGFRVKGVLGDKNIEFSVKKVKGDSTKVYGVLKTDNLFEKSDVPTIIPYTAVFDENIKDISVSYKIISELPAVKCKIHRNDNGKLFLIDESGDITPLTRRK